MSGDDLRARIRQSIDRHLAARAGQPAAGSPRPGHPAFATEACGTHASHQLYLTVINADEACVIEPGVRCDHCGYCRSHGH